MRRTNMVVSFEKNKASWKLILKMLISLLQLAGTKPYHLQNQIKYTA